MQSSSEISKSKIKKSQENIWLSIAFNVVIPVLVLSKMNSLLDPLKTLFLALLFPISYGIFDYWKRKQVSPLAFLGFVSVLIKGTFALYKLDGFWFAVQEGATPICLGLFIIVSAWLGKPIINYLIYNENIFNLELLENKLNENKTRENFKILLWQVTLIFGFVFFLSGVLNYIVAIKIIISPAGTEAFNKELADMTWKSHLIVAVPNLIFSSLGLWWFVHRLKKLTGLNASEILKLE